MAEEEKKEHKKPPEPEKKEAQKPPEPEKKEEKPSPEAPPAEKAKPEEKPSAETSPAEKKEEAGKKKKQKINRLSLKEVEKKIQEVQEKQGGLASSFARQLVKRKEHLLGKTEETAQSGGNDAADS